MTTKNYPQPCKESRTNAEKDWPYDEYYMGERDKEGRKTGRGQYFWSGAESLECYTGKFLRDTKHGVGEYNCRHRGAEDSDLTWEGHYYNNDMHGYGLMSYRNGQVFSGLYHSNLRWGPGVETRICLRENVGLWHGDHLVRLTWKPPYPSVAPDLLSTPTGVQIVSKHRTVLEVKVKKIGETNPALELLKQCGAPPLVASKKWPKLYPNNCTDQRSQLFYADVFDLDFYGQEIHTLVSTNTKAEDYCKKRSQENIESETNSEFYYAWNNNANIIHVMAHCYQHDFQTKHPRIDLEKILNGPRTHFKPAAQEELDCRTFLMACYLGHIRNVSQLINEYDVYPNVTDIQGNSGMMYAVCGNQPEIIHFLIEAGGLVNDYNDACCTPLGAALLIYACTRCDIPPSQMIQAILPPGNIPNENNDISEWKIVRNLTNDSNLGSNNIKTPSTKPSNKPSLAKLSNQIPKKESKPELQSLDAKQDLESGETFSEDKRLYINLLTEFSYKLNELYEAVNPKANMPVNYMFELNDMVAELDLIMEEQQQLQQPKKAVDKKDAKRLSREIPVVNEVAKSHMSLDPVKVQRLDDQMKTIKQLLANGADPRLVNCPQPALFIAIASQSSELVDILIQHGVNTNEKNAYFLDYSPLEVAISKPLSQENVDVISKLLEGGAITKNKVPLATHDTNNSKSSMPGLHGPTLLHVALEKKVDEAEEKIYLDLLALLLHYGCDPIVQYRGSSAMEIAMTKSMEVFNIFIESPKTDLNAAINLSNQTILIKMFFLPYCKTITVAQRLQMLTFLLLYGADPLLKCQNSDICYDNLFEYTKQVETEIFNPTKLTPQKDQNKTKPDKPDQKKKDNASDIKGGANEDFNDFIQTLDLVRDCARILYIRWLQSKLMKEIVELADKYKHRNWTIVLKEYKNGKCCGLWLTPVRCLEIWDILKSTKKRVYNDRTVLKCVLYIVQFQVKKSLKLLKKISSEAKASIESEVGYFVREHASNTILDQVARRIYVRPELTPPNEENKFNVCFECALPLRADKITCSSCKLVSFCTLECMRTNIDRINCHPCSSYLMKKYFPIIIEEETISPSTTII